MNFLHPKYFFSLLICLALSGAVRKCGNTTNDVDCFSDRKTVKEFTEMEGVVKKVGKNVYIIHVADYNNQRYSPCNLQEVWKVDGKQIRFSGNEKEAYPNERWAGLPFVLTMIEQN